MNGARGASKQPGVLRRSQNWIGGTRPGNAVFVPPPPGQVAPLLAELERYIHDATAVASLVAADRRRLLAAPRAGEGAGAGAASLRLFALLPLMPRFPIEQAHLKLDTTFPTATAAVKPLQQLGIATEMTGQKKNRSFSYQGYVELLTR